MSIKKEIVQQIELTKLLPFPDHPFAVRDDEIMQETVESISKYGVLVPAIARPLPDGNYELISGHRRKNACDRAGYKTMPVIVRDLDDDAATIMMVDSNLQRENILPSEKAKAYKMKLEAIKRQGTRVDLTSAQVGRKLETAEIIGQDAGDSRTQVRRYIRLTELKPELQQMVDEGKMGMTPAVELSYYDASITEEHRAEWHGNALEQLRPCDVVFLDPDNGLLVKSVGKKSAKSVKYVFDSELADYLRNGQSVILYSHRQRKKPEAYFGGILSRFESIAELKDKKVFAITFPRGTVRDYFMIAANDVHAEKMKAAILGMSESLWGQLGLCKISII